MRDDNADIRTRDFKRLLDLLRTAIKQLDNKIFSHFAKEFFEFLETGIMNEGCFDLSNYPPNKFIEDLENVIIIAKEIQDEREKELQKMLSDLNENEEEDRS